MKHNNNGSKGLALLLTVAFCLTAICTPLPAAPDSKSELQRQIEELEQENAKIKKQVDQLHERAVDQQEILDRINSQIHNLQKQIDLTNSQMDELDEEIKSLQDSIAQKTKEMDQTLELFKKRLRALYMTGGAASDIALLFSADGTAEYLARQELMKNISRNDKALINRLKEDIASIETETEQMEQNKAEIEQTKKALSVKQSELSEKYDQANDIKKEIDSQKGDAEELRRKQEAEEEALNQKLVAIIMEEKRKAEEAKKEQEKQEESTSSSGSSTSGSSGNSSSSSSGSSSYPVLTSTDFLWPVEGFYHVESPFGMRWGRLHKGIDISQSGIYGEPILAAADGKVSWTSNDENGYGYYVMINHGEKDGKNYTTLYAHMSRYIVSMGQSVKRGQIIGYVGSTGRSTGPHCHFEIRVDGTPVNPMNYFS